MHALSPLPTATGCVVQWAEGALTGVVALLLHTLQCSLRGFLLVLLYGPRPSSKLEAALATNAGCPNGLPAGRYQLPLLDLGGVSNPLVVHRSHPPHELDA